MIQSSAEQLINFIRLLKGVCTLLCDRESQEKEMLEKSV